MITNRLLFAAMVLAAGLAAAQGTDAILSGTVTDPGGLPIPAAQVQAENATTKVVSTTQTNAAGLYVFAALPPGRYRVSAEMQGFSKLAINEVELEVGARVSLNLRLEVGTVAQTVEVSAQNETILGYSTASVGGIVTSKKVLELPVIGRNVLNFTTTQAGTSGDNFSGARIGSLNITMDGVNVQDNRINLGISSPFFISTDLVEEFRVVTSPADVTMGRGSGQISIVTRSGGNEFHGSLFHTLRNPLMNANTWFNNQRGINPETGRPVSPRADLKQNQFGGRIGGPVIRQRTFFHVNYEGLRQRTTAATTATVHTAPARQGLFRFFPGVQNGNANATTPTVDLNGNPVRPANATGVLQTVSVLGRDPNRPSLDPTGIVKKRLDRMPLPNNFRTGDGLNTAGFTWNRSSAVDRDQISVKGDHHFNAQHRASFSYLDEGRIDGNSFLAQPYPDSVGGDTVRGGPIYNLAVTSTLRPTVLNEFRFSANRHSFRFRAPWEISSDVLGTIGGQPVTVVPVLTTNFVNTSNDPQGRISPVYEFSDHLSWQRGRHALKFGAEIRFLSTNGFNSFDVLPRANIGTGGVAVTNISTGANPIPGIGANATGATNLLNDLSGTLSNLVQAFNSPGGPTPVFIGGEGKRRTWRHRNHSFFIADDWKVTPYLTLTAGLRYEYFGVPFEANGKAAALAGGSGAIFGLSGTTFADLYQPGRVAGSLTRVELVGHQSTNSGKSLYGNDWNNFAPALGIAYSLPGKGGIWGKLFGDRRTVLRAGYGWGYERSSLRIVDVVAGDQPGLRERQVFTSGSILNLSNSRLPLTPRGQPLATVPVTDRTQTIRSYDSGLRVPYVQNFSFGLQRALPGQWVLDVRYVGNKGTRLVRGADINEQNIFETKILEAFTTTLAGGNHPLMDQIFMGINLAGLGTVNGTSIRGSELVRRNSTTLSMLAAMDVASFANYLNTSTQFAGSVGGLLRRVNLPENFVVANPQFASARLSGNFANSTYHSLQVELNRRFANGFTVQSNYTWSRALGEEEGDGQEQNDSYRDGRNRRFDKRLLSFHLTHAVRSNVIYDLPFGPQRRFLNRAPAWIARIIEGWQVGAIYNIFSGSPLALTSGVNSYNTFGDNTPTVVGNLDKGSGTVSVDGGGVQYFKGWRPVSDPALANMPQAIAAVSTRRAIADESGRIILVNPTPGTLGTLAQRFLEGPGSFRLDMNVVKRIRLSESKHFELRMDATDVTNSPQWNDPNTDINSTNFGRITGAGGNRIVQVGLRFTF